MTRTTAWKIVMAVVGSAALALAADSEDWAKVQSLREGDRIGIIRADMKRVEGSFVGASESSIVILGDAQMTLSKDDVVRVYQRRKVGRLGRSAIGAAVGVAAGAIVNATLGERFRNEGRDLGTVAVYGGGAAIGAGLGALSGGGDDTVYRRSAPLGVARAR
jgi:hypothetical protein